MRKAWGIGLLIVGYLALIIAGMMIGEWLSASAHFESAAEGVTGKMMIAGMAAIFVLASSLPFVPGAEIGFAMIMMMGNAVVLLVYSCMVLALSISFFIGRFVPVDFLARFFAFIGLAGARNFVLQVADLGPDDRLRLIVERSPGRLVPFLLRHRYLAFALALNIPGNTIVGGGGGLSLIAGMSGLFSTGAFMLSVLVAVAPIPLLVYLTGYEPPTTWLWSLLGLAPDPIFV